MSKRKNISKVTVASQGGKFSLTFAATEKFFNNINDDVHLHPYIRAADVFEAVRSGSTEYGVVPIESSSNGLLHEVYDHLLQENGQIVIVGEVSTFDNVELFSSPGRNEMEVEAIYGHVHLLQVCGDYLDDLDRRRNKKGLDPVERKQCTDSSTACALVKNGNGAAAAVTIPQAAVAYGLESLGVRPATDINAQTRYVVLAQKDSDPLRLVDRARAVVGGPSSSKTSLIVSLPNRSGAVFRMAGCFAMRDMNLDRIVSRPAVKALPVAHKLPNQEDSKKHWNLIFYIDFENHIDPVVTAAALANLREFSSWVIDLGNYKTGVATGEAKAQKWSEMVSVLQ